MWAEWKVTCAPSTSQLKMDHFNELSLLPESELPSFLWSGDIAVKELH